MRRHVYLGIPTDEYDGAMRDEGVTERPSMFEAAEAIIARAQRAAESAVKLAATKASTGV